MRYDLEGLFDDLPIPTLPPEDGSLLDAPITLLDILVAIDSLLNGKALGPDRLSAEFDKVFIHLLAPYLLELFVELIENPSQEDSFHHANTIVLPKP